MAHNALKQDLPNYLRIPLLMLAMVSLIVGALAGIARLGWPVPSLGLSQIPNHGLLMIPAFFGAVIGLERAVAIGRYWGYLSPLAAGLGGLSLLLGWQQTGLLLVLVAGLVFIAASVQVILVQNALHNWILLAGAVALGLGNLALVLDAPMRLPVLWWIVFLVLTIAGERLELSRLAIRSDAKRQGLAALCLLLLLSGLLGPLAYTAAELGLAVALTGISIWLLNYDVARRTVRQAGLPRFTAVCMLSGYLWLMGAGLLLLLSNLGVITVARDLPLHAIFLGFVFSMVLGHALIIFPAVTRLKIPYSPVFYLPLIFLHGSLLLRLVAAPLFFPDLHALGGMLNVVALGLFIIAMIFSLYRGCRQ